MRVLFISGWAESPRVWDPVVALLPAGYHAERIGLFDLLPEVGEGTPEEQLARGFNRCLAERGSFDLYCGWSLGGMVLLGAREVTAPCIVVCASGRFVNPTSPSHAELTALRRRVKRDPRAGVAAFLRTVHGEVPEAELEPNLSYCAGRGAELLVALQYLEEVDLNSSLSARTLLPPLLFVHGGLDPLVPPSAVERTTELCSGADRICFRNSGHAPMLTEAATFASTLIGWAGRRVV